MLMKMKMAKSADHGFLVAGQDEDVQQELDTYVELGQRRGRGTQVSITECATFAKICSLSQTH